MQRPFARLLTSILLPLALMTVLGTGFVLQRTWAAQERELRGRMAAAAEALALIGADGSAEALRELALRSGYERTWVVGSEGVIRASNVATEQGALLAEPWQEQLAAVQGGSVVEAVPWGSRILLLAAYRHAPSGAWGLVLYDTPPWWQGHGWSLVLIPGAGLLFFALCAGFVLWAVRRNLALPTARLQEMARRAVEDDPARVGGATWERVQAQTGPDLGGLAAALATLARDHRRLRESLQGTHTLLTTLADLSTEMYLMGTLDGRVLEVNDTFCERLGVDRQRVVGKPLNVLKVALPVDALLNLAVRSLNEQCAFERVVFTFRTRQRQAVPVTAAVQVLTYLGEPVFVMLAVDRSREREMHRQLAAFHDSVELMVDERVAVVRQEWEGLNDVLGAAGVLVLVLDAKGKIVERNRAVEELLGEAEEPVPDFKRFAQRLVGAQEVRAAFARWVTGGTAATFTCTLRAAAGTEREVVWMTTAVVAATGDAHRLLVGIPEEAEPALVEAPADAAPASPPPAEAAPGGEQEAPAGDADADRDAEELPAEGEAEADVVQAPEEPPA